MTALGGLEPNLGLRVRQPLMAKESLCGSQPADFSLVIAVLRFPSCFDVLPFWLGIARRPYRKNYF
jgi:hypothetical protein